MTDNDERDPLEAELEAMSPIETSPDFRRHIADAMARPKPRPSTTTWLRRAGLLTAAACVAVAIWIGHARNRAATDPKIIVKEADNRRPIATNPPPATSLGAYQRAWAESPARLDALLDADSARPIGPPASAPLPLFARAGRDLIP